MVITSIDIAAVHRRRRRRDCGFDAPATPPVRLYARESNSPTATFGNYNTPLGDHCDVGHNDHAGIYTTNDARAGCPVATTGTKNRPGRNPRPGRLEPGRGAEPGGAVGALPGEVRLGAAEVAVGRGLRVDRAEQVE